MAHVGAVGLEEEVGVVGKLHLEAEAVALDFHNAAVGKVRCHISLYRSRHDGGRYGGAAAGLNFFPLAVGVEFQFYAAYEVDLIFGTQKAVVFLSLADTVAGEVRVDKGNGCRGEARCASRECRQRL